MAPLSTTDFWETALVTPPPLQPGAGSASWEVAEITILQDFPYEPFAEVLE